MNLFDTTRETLDRVSGAHWDGYRKGFAEGRDTGRTEAFNDVRDAIDTSTVRTRASKARLVEHIEKQR